MFFCSFSFGSIDPPQPVFGQAVMSFNLDGGGHFIFTFCPTAELETKISRRVVIRIRFIAKASGKFGVNDAKARGTYITMLIIVECAECCGKPWSEIENSPPQSIH